MALLFSLHKNQNGLGSTLQSAIHGKNYASFVNEGIGGTTSGLFRHSERFLEELCNVRSIGWTETIEFIGPWILGKKLKTSAYFLLSLIMPRIRDENRKESSSIRRITLVWDINHPISLRRKCFDTILRSHF